VADLEHLTADEVARELMVTKAVVMTLARRGTLPAQRRPALPLRFERGLFEDWIREQCADNRRPDP
jgi:hypothetical protein